MIAMQIGHLVQAKEQEEDGRMSNLQDKEESFRRKRTSTTLLPNKRVQAHLHMKIKLMANRRNTLESELR